MENGPLHDDNLFRAVNDRLSDYEAPYNGADWDAMSRSLDQLPKTSRVQWKISLNTILVVVGVAGLSFLGYALASDSGRNTPVEAMKSSTTTTRETPPVPQHTALTTNVAPQPVAATEPAPAATNALLQTADLVAAATAPDGQVKRQKKNQPEKLLFGDQIDRRKGFIYATQEDPSVIDNYKSKPVNTYYDMDHGQVKQIKLDSTREKGEIRKYTPDSTASFAPTGGERGGFQDIEGNR